MRSKLWVSLAILLLVVSCGPKEAPVVPKVTVNWANRKIDQANPDLSRTLHKRNGDSYWTATQPVSLSAHVPDQVELRLSLPSKDSIREKGSERIDIELHTHLGEAGEKHYHLNFFPAAFDLKPSARSIELKIEITGLRNILSDEVSQTLGIQIELRRAQNRELLERVDLTLLTPPSDLKSDQMAIRDFENEYGREVASYSLLQSPSVRWDLLQVVQLHNPSPRPVEVKIPVHPSGSLYNEETFYWPEARKQSFCTSKVEATKKWNFITEDFSIFPMTPDTFARWPELQEREDFTVVLLPEGEIRLGVYAQGEKVPDLLALQSKRKARLDLVDTSCDFGCAHPQWPTRFSEQCNQVPDPEAKTRCQERVAACAPCLEKAAQSKKEFEFSQECNHCHAVEHSQSVTEIFKYGGRVACHFWTYRVNKQEKLKHGFEYSKTFLEFYSSDLIAWARYAGPPKTEDPESRAIAILREEAVQSEF